MAPPRGPELTCGKDMGRGMCRWYAYCLLLIAYLPPSFYRQIRKVVFLEPVGQVEEMNEGKTTYLDLTAFSFHIMKKVTASLSATYNNTEIV